MWFLSYTPKLCQFALDNSSAKSRPVKIVRCWLSVRNNIIIESGMVLESALERNLWRWTEGTETAAASYDGERKGTRTAVGGGGRGFHLPTMRAPTVTEPHVHRYMALRRLDDDLEIHSSSPVTISVRQNWVHLRVHRDISLTPCLLVIRGLVNGSCGRLCSVTHYKFLPPRPWLRHELQVDL